MAAEARFRKSISWQNAIDLATAVYEVTNPFPREEMFGLTGQLRCAAVSIASNIAEGQGRTSVGEFIQFIGMARGSALEVETQLNLAGRLSFGKAHELERVQGMASELTTILNAILATTRARAAAKKKSGRPAPTMTLSNY
jgi:four helix bundle protein